LVCGVLGLHLRQCDNEGAIQSLCPIHKQRWDVQRKDGVMDLSEWQESGVLDDSHVHRLGCQDRSHLYQRRLDARARMNLIPIYLDERDCLQPSRKVVDGGDIL
jgi:hypothetical protein